MSSAATTTATTADRPLRVGLIGGGVVGGGTYEILMGGRLLGSSSSSSSSSSSPSIVVTKLFVQDTTKPRDFTIDANLTTVVTDVHSILEDEEIDIVVEIMEGNDDNDNANDNDNEMALAKTIVTEALTSKKAVVTANKALLAEHLEELQTLAVANHTPLAYEAAVCGGIPIIQTLHSSYTGDVITEIMGICHGTTNYMLGKMEDSSSAAGGAEYKDVLQEAQDLGLAEAAADGHKDVRATMCLLAKLSFGTTVKVEDVPCRGMAQITPVDFEYAKLLGCTIKLLGTAKRLPKDGQYDGPLSVYVAPTVVPYHHGLATVRGSNNAVAITSANMGTCSYTGPGAGRFPTANSIVADVVRIAKKQAMTDPFPLHSQLDLDPNYVSAHYIRIPFQDSLGIIRLIGELAEVHGISIHSVLQNPIADKMSADFCITTEDSTASQVDGFCAAVAREDFCRSPPLCMPLLMEL